MGLLDSFRGIHRPARGVAVLSRAEVEQRMLALNHEKVPFAVRPSEESDLEVEWKLVDALWGEFFARAALPRTHRISVRLDEAKHEARALEEWWAVEWEAGAPRLSSTATSSRGRTRDAKSTGSAYAFEGAHPLDPGTTYSYHFVVPEMRLPLIEVVTSSGWTWVPVGSRGKM